MDIQNNESVQNDSREGEVTRYRRGHFFSCGKSLKSAAADSHQSLLCIAPLVRRSFSCRTLVKCLAPNVSHHVYQQNDLPVLHKTLVRTVRTFFGPLVLYRFTPLLMGWQVWLFLALVIAPHHTTLWVSDSAVETCRKYQHVTTDEQNPMTKCAERAVGDMLQK